MWRIFLWGGIGCLIAAAAYLVAPRILLYYHAKDLGIPVSLTNDTVPQLLEARYRGLTAAYPYFALESVDLEDFSIATDLLDAAKQRIAQYYTAEERLHIESSLYPTDFFKTIKNLEEARRRYLSEPNYENGSSYNQLLLETIIGYTNALDTLIDTYEFIAQREEPQTFYGLYGSGSIPDIIDTLRTLRQDMDGQKRRILARITCHTQVWGCTWSNNDPWPLTEQSKTIGPTPEAIRALLIAGFAQSSSTTAPYAPVRLLTHACSEKEALFQITTYTRNMTADFHITELNDLYFFDLRAPGPYGPYLTAIKSQGVPLLYQSPDNEYLCPDSGYNTTRVATLYTLATALHMADTAVINESDVLATLANNTSSTLQVLNRANTARLPEIITHLATLSDFLAADFAHGSPKTPLVQLFVGNGYPSITLMLFNKTIVGSSHPTLITLDTDVTTAYLERLNLVRYSDPAARISEMDALTAIKTHTAARRAIRLKDTSPEPR